MTSANPPIYGAGAFALSSYATLRQIFYALFLTDVVGVDPRAASLAPMLGLAWDLVVLPRIGALTDHTRSRIGRRRPYLVLGGPLFALGFVILWWSPPWASQVALTLHVVVAFLVAGTLQSLVTVPYLALTPELARDYDERTLLTAWRTGFAIAASLAIAVLVPDLLARWTTALGSRAAAHLAVAAGLGALAGVVLSGVGLAVREDPRVPDPGRVTIRSVWTNLPFRSVAVLYGLTWTAFDLVALMIPYFLTWRMSAGDPAATLDLLGTRVHLTSAVLGTLLVSGLLSVPLWVRVASRLGKRETFVLGAALWSLAQLALVAVPSTQPGWVVVLAAVAGTAVGMAHVLPDAMIPDALDWEEARTGRRIEGTYYAAVDLLRRLAGATALFVALQGLGWSGYARPPVDTVGFTQPRSAERAILALTGPAACLLLVGAMLAAWRFPIGRERHAALREEVERRRAAGGVPTPPTG